MQEQPPSLQQYPGYYPRGTRTFWTRTKVGSAAGLAGLVLGLGFSGSTDGEDARQAAAQMPALSQSDLNAAVAEVTETYESRLEEQASEANGAATQAEQQAKREQRQAVKAAVAKARREERARAATALKKARQAADEAIEQAQSAPAPQAPAAPQPLASSGGTDPQFNYCYEANDRGYGPYYQGEDPEYDWYDDADNDGVVCET